MMRALRISGYFAASLLLALLTACSTGKEKPNTVILDARVKTAAKEVQMDTVRVDSVFLHARRFFVYADSVLVVVNKPNAECPTLQLYNLNTQRLIADFLSQGRGPGEVLSATVTLEGKTLQVCDFIQKQVAFIDLDSLLHEPQRRIPLQDYLHTSYGMNRAADGKTIFENPYCFRNEKMGIDNGAPRLLFGNAQTKLADFGTYPYDTYNVAQGYVMTNPEKTKIVYVSLSEPLAEIYDMRGERLRTIRGPEWEGQEYRVDENEAGAKEVIFKTTIPLAYRGYCLSEKCFFLSYAGGSLAWEQDEKDFPCWIFRFDWQGNLMGSYYAGRYLNALSLGMDARSLYATGFDRDRIPQLLRLTLP